METTGIVRKTDPFGRIVIPKEVREILDILECTPMEIYTEGKTIILKKHEPNCLFCDSVNDLMPYKGKLVCISCLKDLDEIDK